MRNRYPSLCEEQNCYFFCRKITGSRTQNQQAGAGRPLSRCCDCDKVPKVFVNYYSTLRFASSGIRDGAVVRALAFHQCGPGSIPGLDVICGLSLLLVLFSAPRGFSPGTPVFPSPQKPTFLNSNSIRNARAFNTWAPGSGDWATTPHAIELK